MSKGLILYVLVALPACGNEHFTGGMPAAGNKPSASPTHTSSSQDHVGWTRQAGIWIRGNDGPSPGDALMVGQATRLVAWVDIGDGPPGEGPRGMVEDLPDTRLYWRSTRPDVASVDSAGLLTARRPGRAYIIATARALTVTARIAEGLIDSMPVQVRPLDSALASMQFTTVSAPATSDAYSTCATTQGGEVLCWGAEWLESGFGSDSLWSIREFKSPDGAPFVQVGAGFGAACALTARGEAFCWGHNEWGQLGVGSVQPLSVMAPVVGGYRFQKLSVGRDRACAISNSNQLYCWGSGLNRALGASSRERCAYQIASEMGGRDTTYMAYAPCAREPVPIMPAMRVRDVAVGDDHGCALANDGALYCWGYVYNIDFDESRPVHIGRIPLVALTSGSRHVCAIDASGQAYCWGRNWRGQLGQPRPKSGNQDLIRVAGPVRFRSLSAGDNHTCGVSIDGRAYCWGENGDGQLGTGIVGHDFQPTSIPSPVASPLRFTAIAAGYEHTCAVSSQGGMFCWGTGLAVRTDLHVLKEEPEPFWIAGPH